MYRVDAVEHFKYRGLDRPIGEFVHLFDETVDMRDQRIPLVVRHEADEGLRVLRRRLKFYLIGICHRAATLPVQCSVQSSPHLE